MIKKIILGLLAVILAAIFIWAVSQLFKEGENAPAEEVNEEELVDDLIEEVSFMEEEIESGEEGMIGDDVLEESETVEGTNEVEAGGEDATTDETVTSEADFLKELEQDGLKIKILKEGSGQRMVENGNKAVVHYVGKLTNGRKFDSSIDRSQPFEFTVGKGEVIQGWEIGVLKMRIGEKRQLTIPAELGYGAAGAGGVIPPNATLIFEIELLSIK